MDGRAVPLHQVGDRAVDQLLLFHAPELCKSVGSHSNREVAGTPGVDREIAALERALDRGAHLFDDGGGVIAENVQGHGAYDSGLFGDEN